MSILALCLEDKEINVMRCALLAAIHDLAEARVGDIAPSDGISKEDKKALEASAMNNFTESMLGGSQSVVSTRIMDLWQEYELQESAEARLVKGATIWFFEYPTSFKQSPIDLDLFEMALQAMEYEKRGGGEKCLSTFFESSIPRIRHTEVKRWAESLLEERKSFWDGFGKDGSVGGS
ncbi:hypothetical protein FRB99_004089 [Tulasnella sp. 403]|nr:hypothetical protein FRB99_004089 [Tulasnella sp. 403]